MAIMHPENIEVYNYTASEKVFYNELKDQLPDDYHVFYSITWYDSKGDYSLNSECDFMVFDPRRGFITIEVKGGNSIDIKDEKWIIKSFGYSDRILKRSPLLQAEENMRYFKKYYEMVNNARFSGVYGFCVAFPFYNVDKRKFNYDESIIINFSDMKNLKNKVDQIFLYFAKSNNIRMNLSSDQRRRFISSVNKRISLSAAAGSLIEIKEKQLNVINRIQNNYIEFIKNYNQAYIIGGAGTGKTFIGIKKALSVFNEDNKKRILITCVSKKLSSYIKQTINNELIDCKTISELYTEILSSEITHTMITEFSEKLFEEVVNESSLKYDCIIVDEAQDLDQYTSLALKSLLKDDNESIFYVFFDEFQNVFLQDFAINFLMDYPVFQLTENIRNTASILKFTLNRTDLIPNMTPNPVDGAEPEIRKIKNNKELVRNLEKLLNSLIDEESVNISDIVILVDKQLEESLISKNSHIGRFDINLEKSNELKIFEVKDFKGLESNVVIYLKECKEDILDYIAYTRAKYYLYIFNAV